MRVMWVVLPIVVGCGPDAGDVRVAPRAFLGDGTIPTHPEASDDPDDPQDPTDPGDPVDPLVGFIGSPCIDDLDCPYDGGTCLLDTEGFPGGMCSAPCDQFCPDADGYPTTFCTDIAELPVAVDWLGDGGCSQRCDFGIYPYTGCRDDYGCVEVGRANDPSSATYVCMPDVPSAMSGCLEDLAGRGVPFSPTVIADGSPTDAPSLTCHVEDPISFQPGYLGIDLIYYTGAEGAPVSGACELGHALADTFENVQPEGVDVVRHLGTYVCRTISGTSTLSRHAYGDAIDIYGFDFSDGSWTTLEDDWEHETTSFTTPEAEWLYDTSYDWYLQGIWNIVLTPNYNSAHDNHFHVDLTPGSDYIGVMGPGYFGPAPYED